MKILYISHHFYPCIGGTEKVIEDLCMNLRRKGIESDVLCLNRCPGSGKRLPAIENYKDITTFRIPYLDLKFYKFAPFSLHRLQQYDVVHVHGIGFFSDFLAITKFLHRKPLILSTHGGIFHTKVLGIIKKIYFLFWTRLMLHAFDKIIAVSAEDATLFSRIVPKDKIVTIENGIDLGRFKDIKRKPIKNSFLAVGRLSRNKQLPLLITVFAEIAKKNPHAELNIVGADFDNIASELEYQVNILGIADKVKIFGEIPEQQLLQQFAWNEFFISASAYEGFGISAVEAMACGLIPILNKIPAFEALVEDGKNGFLIDFTDTKKAAVRICAILKMSDRERHKISNAAMESVARFDWSTRIDKFIREYKQVKK